MRWSISVFLLASACAATVEDREILNYSGSGSFAGPPSLPPMPTMQMVEIFRETCLEDYPDLQQAIAGLEERNFEIVNVGDWASSTENGEEISIDYSPVPNDIPPMTWLQSRENDISSSIGVGRVATGDGSPVSFDDLCEVFGTTTDLLDIDVLDIWQALGLSPEDDRLVFGRFAKGQQLFEVYLGSDLLEVSEHGNWARAMCRNGRVSSNCDFIHLIVSDVDEP